MMTNNMRFGAGTAAPERLLNPQKQTPAVGAGAARDQENEHHDSAATRAGCVACTDSLKAWKTAQARCILAGHHATLIDDDTGRPMLIVSKWALTRSFHTVADVEAWLARVTGGAA